jgi:hypothetical protein
VFIAAIINQQPKGDWNMPKESSVTTPVIKHFRWRRVYGPPTEPHGDTRVYRNCWIEPTGELHNPNQYPEAEVRAAIEEADIREANRLAGAMKRRVATRKQRRELRIHEVARKILARAAIDEKRCYICRKKLADLESVARGIGTECWQRVLDEVTKLKTEAAETDSQAKERA